MDQKRSDTERAEICVEFALRARHIRDEVDQYADALADGDQTLRAELRVIEEWLW